MSGVKNITSSKNSHKTSKLINNSTNSSSNTESDDYDLDNIDFKKIIGNCKSKKPRLDRKKVDNKLENMETNDIITSCNSNKTQSDIELKELCAVSVKNRYTVLSELDESSEDEGKFEKVKQRQKKNKKTTSQTVLTQNKNDVEMTETTPKVSKERPPPIHLCSLLTDKLNVLIKNIKNITSEFHIRQNFNQKETIIYFKNMIDYKKFILLKGDELPFYTYTPKSAKKFTYILKGLGSDIEAEEIYNEIVEYNIGIIKVMKMNNTKYPTYMVLLSKYFTILDLAKKIKYLNHTKIYWDLYINKKIAVQCKKCQMWGHVSTNCFMKTSRCVKCGGDHLTHECLELNGIVTEPKCANCAGNHPASSVNCPVYQKLAQKRTQQMQNKQIARTSNMRKFVPAPLPQQNAWASNRVSNSQPDPLPSVGRSEEFPKLPNKSKTYDAPRPNNNNNGNNSSSYMMEDINNLSTIRDTLKEINKLVDLKKLARQVTILHERLKTATTQTERLMAFLAMDEEDNE